MCIFKLNPNTKNRYKTLYFLITTRVTNTKQNSDQQSNDITPPHSCLKMTSLCEKRLMSDFKNLINSKPKTYMASPFKDDIHKWAAVILGPENTAWDGAALCLSMKFSSEYPTKPPEIQFITHVFHPNVYNDGRICLDILKEKWSPAYDISSVLVSIQSLLVDPNPNSPANGEAANLYVRDRNGFDMRVSKVAEESWEQLNENDHGPYIELLNKLIGEEE